MGILAGMQVRTARPSDARTVEGLRLRTWQAAYRGLVPDSFLDALTLSDESLRRWATRLAEPGIRTLVGVDDDGRLLGLAVAGPARDEDATGSRELYALYVDAGSWRSGAGTALLAEVGPVDLLWVLEGNVRARGFYERRGFRPDGARTILQLDGPVAEVRYRAAEGAPLG